MVYSFDENYIGRVKTLCNKRPVGRVRQKAQEKYGNELQTREIERHHLMNDHQWYAFANQVCNIINGKAA